MILSSLNFRRSLTQVKRYFCKGVNSILGKIGLSSEENIVLHLIRTKCMPLLLYAAEACPFSTADLRSLDFVVTRFMTKIFRTINRNLVMECMDNFGFLLPSVLIPVRTAKFCSKLAVCDTAIVHLYKI